MVVVISEFGALCATAQAEGVLDDVLYPLSLILREAGATGVHVLIEDQVVDQRWPRGISANAEPVTGYLPVNYGAAGGTTTPTSWRPISSTTAVRSSGRGPWPPFCRWRWRVYSGRSS